MALTEMWVPFLVIMQHEMQHKKEKVPISRDFTVQEKGLEPS